MAIYRISRNLEASIIDYFKSLLTQSGGWSNIAVEKTFKRVYGIPLDANTTSAVVCVRLTDTRPTKIEVGSESIMRTALILVDIFASSDGQRLDLKDYMLDIIRHGIPYYEYQVSGNTVTSKVRNGNIRILTITDAPVNLNVDKSQLEVQDRYRHLFTLEVSLSRVEV